jgi:HK97 family phage major capsid protein
MPSKELREQRVKIAADMAIVSTEITDQLAKEKGQRDEGKLAEARKKFDLMDADVASIKVKIDEMEDDEARVAKAAALDAELRKSRKPPETAQPGDIGLPGAGGFDDPAVAERYKKAFRNYLKFGWAARPDKGIYGITQEDRNTLTPYSQQVEVTAADMGRARELRDMGSGGQGAYPGATTGFFVPVGFTMAIEEALKYYGDMLNVGEILPTATGQPLPYPTDNDTTIMGELIGEGQQVTTQDVSIGQITLGAWKFSSRLVKVSLELLQDSAFDLESYLIKKFATRLGRILNNQFTIGTGTSAPQGIIVGATLGIGSGTTPVLIGNDNLTSPDTTQQVGYQDLVNLEHSVDPLYRRTGKTLTAKWMFHDSTLRYIKTLKDLFGRPLWVPSVEVNATDKILGYTYSINNDMATLAANNITVAFGALEKYLIRRVMDMRVLRLEERFADYGQVAFLAFTRYDARLLDAGTHPVKYIQQS